MLPILELVEEHARRLWVKRWLIIAITWLVCLIGWPMIALIPNRYTATAQLFVNTHSLLKPLMRDMAVEPDIMAQIEIIRRSLLSDSNIRDIANVVGGGDSDDLQRRLWRISIKDDGPTQNLFVVSYQDPDPRRALKVVEAFIALFIRQARGVGTKSIVEARDFINSQVAEYEKRLSASEAALAGFQRAHAEELASASARSFERQEENTEIELGRLGAELQSAIWEREQLKNELARTPPILSATPRAEAALSPERAHLEQMQQDLAALQRMYTDRHPDVIALKRQIETAQANLSADGGTVPRKAKKNASTLTASDPPNPTYQRLQEELRRVETQIVAANSRIQAQKARLDELRRERAGVPEVTARLAQLNRDYDVLKANYAKLIDRRESATLSENLEVHGASEQLRVIEPASLPKSPSWPPYRHLFYLSVPLIGLAAASALVIGQQLLSGRIGSLAQLRAISSFPVLGTISSTNRRHALWRIIDKVSLAGVIGGLAFLLLCLVHYSPSFDKARVGTIAESVYAKLRTSL